MMSADDTTIAAADSKDVVPPPPPYTHTADVPVFSAGRSTPLRRRGLFAADPEATE
jgi:hypothetical protein